MHIDPKELGKIPVVFPRVSGASRVSTLAPGQNLILQPGVKFWDLFQEGTTLTYWNRGEIDQYLRGTVSTRNALELSRYGETPLDGSSLWWPSPGTSPSIGPKRSRRRVTNLKEWVRKGWVPKTEADIALCRSQLTKIGKYIPLSMVSLPSTISNHLLDQCPEEFFFVGHYWGAEGKEGFFLRPDKVHILQTYLRAYPARLEYSLAGTINNTENIDQYKSHLVKLATLPSLDKRQNIEWVRENVKTKIPGAYPGSLYIIRTDIPESYWGGLIPAAGGWPVGHIEESDPIAKPYLDLLDDLGIRYEILWDYTIKVKDLETQPFRGLAERIAYIEEWIKQECFPIRPQALHHTIAGHMMHLRYEYVPPHLNRPAWITSSKDFNPVIAVAIKALSMVETIRAGLRARELIANREDAITGRGLTTPEGFRLDTSGSLFVVRGNVRDKPGNHFWRDLAEDYKDAIGLPIEYPIYNTVHNYDPTRPLGARESLRRAITPGSHLRGPPTWLGAPNSTEQAFEDVYKVNPPMRAFLEGELVMRALTVPQLKTRKQRDREIDTEFAEMWERLHNARSDAD